MQMQIVPIPECEKDGPHGKKGNEKEPASEKIHGILIGGSNHHPANTGNKEEADRTKGVDKSAYHDTSLDFRGGYGKPLRPSRSIQESVPLVEGIAPALLGSTVTQVFRLRPKPLKAHPGTMWRKTCPWCA